MIDFRNRLLKCFCSNQNKEQLKKFSIQRIFFEVIIIISTTKISILDKLPAKVRQKQ